MRLRVIAWTGAVLAVAASGWAQVTVHTVSPRAGEAGAPPAPRVTATHAPTPTPTPVPTVEGYTGVLEMDASVPALRDGGSSAPEAQALVGRLRDKSRLEARLFLAQDLSRLEILSTDFVLPAGTVVLHQAGARFYVIADPESRTWVKMDAGNILNALEGGLGVVNTEYKAKLEHSMERRQVGGLDCRKSILSVTYASAIPFESESILVQQKNDIEIWHTSALASAALLDHFFFKFDRDKSGAVHKLASAELGFPVEMTMTVSAGAADRKAAGGTLRMSVRDIRREKKLDAELFRLPPAGYRQLERSPYFKAAALPAP
jgi:hypothetical protein